MIRRIRLASIVLALGLVSGGAHAAPQGRDLNGSASSFEAYYDTDRNITWLADANYAKTSGYDADGKMTWNAANTWAASLSFTDGVNTYDNWRLPTSDTCSGYNCSGSEMGHLFYSELGGTAGQSILSSSDADVVKFTNLQADLYWSGSEYPPSTSISSTSNAWRFYFGDGGQYAAYKPSGFSALAVSPGDVGAVAAVPVPTAAWLLGSGLLGLMGVARRRG